MKSPEEARILDEGGPVWTRSATGHLCLTVRHVDSVYADVKSRGIRIARDLQKESRPARGFDIRDPSGNEVHIWQREESSARLRRRLQFRPPQSQ